MEYLKYVILIYLITLIVWIILHNNRSYDLGHIYNSLDGLEQEILAYSTVRSPYVDGKDRVDTSLGPNGTDFFRARYWKDPGPYESVLKYVLMACVFVGLNIIFPYSHLDTSASYSIWHFLYLAIAGISGVITNEYFESRYKQRYYRRIAECYKMGYIELLTKEDE